MSLDIVIPHVPGVGAENLLIGCINSFDSYNNIIIESDETKSFAQNVNAGLLKSKAEFIIVANNDTKLIQGSLNALIDPLGITVPTILPPAKDNNPRCFFCMPRWVYQYFLHTDGYFYDERFERGYWEDDDLIKRIEREQFSVKLVPEVVIEHLNGGGFTIKQFGEQDYHDKNRRIFEEKWRN